MQHDVPEVVQQILDQIFAALANGDNVELRNFGVFEVRLTKPRVGRNLNVPGSVVKIPTRAAVNFKPGKMMHQKASKLSARFCKIDDG